MNAKETCFVRIPGGEVPAETAHAAIAEIL